ncbi:MAG: hypothetical protein QNJ47_25845 [Nostocaceae cyanobacterium]|nr:hypothetical protein [Nostocaceae cyanobacterium]
MDWFDTPRSKDTGILGSSSSHKPLCPYSQSPIGTRAISKPDIRRIG